MVEQDINESYQKGYYFGEKDRTELKPSDVNKSYILNGLRWLNAPSRYDYEKFKEGYIDGYLESEKRNEVL